MENFDIRVIIGVAIPFIGTLLGAGTSGISGRYRLPSGAGCGFGLKSKKF